MILILKSLCLIFLVSACAARSTSSDDISFCSTQTHEIVKVLLHKGLDPNKPLLPDYGIASEHTPIYVLNEVVNDSCKLNESVLPDFEDNRVELVERNSLNRIAKTRDGRLVHVAIQSIEIEEDKASAWMGVSVKYHNSDKGPSLCCCGGMFLLELLGTKWHFKEKSMVVCA